MENFEHRGFWWLPDDENKRVGGLLCFTDGTFRLKLIGSLANVSFPPQKYESYPIILGTVSNGTIITLLDCETVNVETYHGSESFVISHEFRPRVAYLGLHSASQHNPTFETAYVRFTYLLDWVNPVSWQVRPLGDDITAIQIDCNTPQDFVASTSKVSVSSIL